jgi:polysaccharide biosynthesis protein PslH
LKKIIVLTSRFPYPLERGDKLRIFHQIKQLSASFEVVLVALTDDSTTENHLAALSPFAKVYTIKTSFFQKGINLAKGWWKGLPLSVANFTNDDVLAKIKNIIAKEKPDAIYTQLIRMAEYVKNIDGFKVLDYQDAFGENMKRRAEKSSFPLRPIFQHEAKRLMEYEEKAYDFFNEHLIISEADREMLVFKKKKNIKICQNGIDLAFFQSKNKEKKYDLVFVGNLGYHPNIEAAKILVHEILPPIIKKHPHLKVLLAGARPSAAVKNLASENVTVSGWLEDIRDAYDESKIFVAPLFQGSGQQNKVLETMAMQVPCVTTPMVNQSTGAVPDEAVLVASNVDEFVEKIFLLLENENICNRLKINALQFVNENFSWKKTTQNLIEIFEKNT